jgi:imidazolonepropionase-like amidohydrolase
MGPIMKFLFVLLFLCNIPVLSRAQVSQTPRSESFALINVTVVDVTNGLTRPGMTVVITGNRISAIGPARRLRVGKGTRMIYAPGKFLIPGLWDMHVHLFYFGEQSLRVFLANGVTGVRDMGDGFVQVKSWRDGVSAGVRLGPRIKCAGPILESAQWVEAVRELNKKAGNKGIDWLAFRVAVRSPEDARRAVAANAEAGADFIKIRTNASRETFLAIAEEARRRGLPFVGHQPSGVSLAEASDAGMASIEHGFFPELKINQEERKALFRRFATNGTAIVPTLIATRNFRLLPERVLNSALSRNNRDLRRRYITSALLEQWLEDIKLQKEETPFDWQGVYRGTTRDIREMAGLGVNILAGTDASSVLVFPGFSLHEELELLVKDAGLTPLQALQAATINAAKFLRLSDSLGAVEEGKIADLVLLKANPLENISNTRNIAAVVVNGRYLSQKALRKMLAEAAANMSGLHH